MRKVKAGKKGQSTKYISRAKAIRKLQLSLKDFRKLCILKGVYPREPPKKLKKTNRTYYHKKDVNFLALDPLIQKFRQQKVYLRKYKRAKAKGDIGKLRYLATHKPKISLNHLVRERYPDFIDALRDLDDPLSLLALFTIFPTHKQFGLSQSKIEACTKLLKHFQLYVIKTHSLKKSFVSIKGIYYQSQIMNQKVTYMIPFKYPANLPLDVDYRVMSTFLDFYIVLMKFINFKLYQSIGLKYPPVQAEDQSTYQGYQFDKITAENQQDDQKYQIDQQFANKATQNQDLLFSGFHFYLSTQVPRYSLEYIILSNGGTVQLTENHSGITHVITDRQNFVIQKNKQYVQPQWVYDSINFNKLLNVKQYWIGKTLPPHVSPFVDENDQERYMPEREKELRGLQTAPENQYSTTPVDKNASAYDIIEEKKKQIANKKLQEKQFSQISKNLISNKNRKLLRNIEHGKQQKKQALDKLVEKSKKVNNKSK